MTEQIVAALSLYNKLESMPKDSSQMGSCLD